MVNVLEVTDLRKHFGGVPAVDGVSFQVAEGSLVALIGPNGSGKSTTLDVISGMSRCDGGRVTLDAQDITNEPAYRLAGRGLTRSFQVARVWQRLSVLENLLVAGTPAAADTVLGAFRSSRQQRRALAEVEERSHDILARFGLLNHAHQAAEVLSGGQRRLLEFGRILMSGARVVLLDEPLAGVNPAMIHSIQEAILSLKQAGRTILLVEHNLEAVAALSDYTLVMAMGKILARGSLQEVSALPEVMRAYLGEDTVLQ